jgi:dynein heavy chain, axonemal
MATTAATTGSLSSLNNAFENDKKKAAANVGAIEKKRALLDVRHRYLIEKFAAFVDEKPIVIENSLLLGQKLDLVNDFLAEGGSRKVLFFWQKVIKFLTLGRRSSCQICYSSGKN